MEQERVVHLLVYCLVCQLLNKPKASLQEDVFDHLHAQRDKDEYLR